MDSGSGSMSSSQMRTARVVIDWWGWKRRLRLEEGWRRMEIGVEEVAAERERFWERSERVCGGVVGLPQRMTTAATEDAAA